MNDATTLEDRIIAIVAQVVPVKPEAIKMEHKLAADLGMDSVSSMEFLSMLSEELNVDVEIEDVVNVKTVRDSVELARRFLAMRKSAS